MGEENCGGYGKFRGVPPNDAGESLIFKLNVKRKYI
jgi:hypothetical protein